MNTISTSQSQTRSRHRPVVLSFPSEAVLKEARSHQTATRAVPTSEPTIHRDEAQISCSFNVMKDAPVREELRIHEYRIWDQYAEATFDREYQSSMEKSPDHLIFLTGLVHTQKLLYLVLSKKFGFEYKSGEKEKLKIWPTQVDVSMPSMIRKNRGVLQRLWVTAIKQLSPTRYEVHLISDFEGVVKIHSTAAVFLI